MSCTNRYLHAASILSADLKEGVGDLAQGAVLDGFHEFFEEVFVVDGLGLQAPEHLVALVAAAGPEVLYALDLEFLFLGGAADDFLRQDCG